MYAIRSYYEPRSLDLHQFGFFLRQNLVNIGNGSVGDMLNFILRLAFLVLGNLLFLSYNFV